MGYSCYVGRVGALAVALGVGVAVASTPGVAWADDSTTAGGEAAPGHSAPPKPGGDNQPPSNDDPDADTPGTTNNTTTAGSQTTTTGSQTTTTGSQTTTTGSQTTTTGSQTTTTIGGHGSPQVTISGSTVNTSNNDGGDTAETKPAAADQQDTTGVSQTPTAGVDPAPSVTPTVEPAPSTPPPAAPSEDIAATTDLPQAPGETPPPGGPAPQGNSGQAPPATGNTISMSRVGQSTAGSLDTKQPSLVPSGLGPSQSRLVNQAAAGSATTGQHLIAASGAQSARTALQSSSQDPVGLPGTVASVAKTVVTALLSPFVAPGPGSPVESPMLWAMLGWIRREPQRTTVTTATVVKPQETTLVVDPVGAPLALKAAATPSAAAPTAGLLRRNVAPIARPDVYTTTEDTARTVTGRGVLGNDFDLNGDPLTAALVSAPKNGSVTLNSNGSFTYAPKANYSGVDSFTYRASDGITTSNVSTVVVNVTAVNDPPVAAADTYSTAKGVKLTVAAAAGVLKNDTDPDSKNLTAKLVSRPSNGTLTLNSNGSFTYTPRANYSGTDTFTYRASDGKTTSAPTTVSITVGNLNTAPVANNDTATVAEGSSTAITVLANDTDAQGNTTINRSTVQVLTGPRNGTASVNTTTGVVTYQSNGAEVTSDSFTYRVKDTTGAVSNTATVNITITPVNDGPPVAHDDAGTVAEGATIPSINVVGNDTDPDGTATIDPTSVIVTQPGHGTASVNPDGSIKYISNGDEVTSDSFTYTVKDTSNATSNAATVTVAITASTPSTPVVDPTHPYTPDPVQPGDPQGTVRGHVNVTDPQHLPLTYTGTTTTTQGAVTVNNAGTFRYTPSAQARHDATADNATQTGADTFNFTVTATNSSGVTVTVPVSAPIEPSLNQVPTAPTTTPSRTLDPTDGKITSTIGYADPENDTLTYTGPVGGLTAGGGTVTVNTNGTYTYTPDPADRHPAATGGAAATDSFDVVVTDGHGSTQTVTVHVAIDPTNQVPAPPVTQPVSPVTDHSDGTVVGNLGYIDLDDDQLTYTGPESEKTVAGGTVQVYSDGAYFYTPDPADRLNAYTHPDQNTDSFDVTITDSHGSTQTVTVHVTIDPTPAAVTQAVPLNNVGTGPGGTSFGPDGSSYTSGYRFTDQGAEPVVVVVDGTTGETQYISIPGGSTYSYPAGSVMFGSDGTPYQTWTDYDTATGQNTTSVSKIDTITGTATLVGSGSGSPDQVVMGPDGTVYLRTTTSAGGRQRDHLWVMKPNSGTSVDVVPTDHPDQPYYAPYDGGDLVIGPDGTAYQTLEWDEDNSQRHTVVLVIDKDTGEATPVALDGPPRGGAVVDRNGTAYQATTFGNWLSAITSDGQATPVPIGNDLPWNPPSVGPDGAVYYASGGFNSFAVARIDPDTHEVSEVGNVAAPGMRPSQYQRVIVGSNGLIYVNSYDGTESTTTPNGMTIIDPQTGTSKTVHYGEGYSSFGDPDIGPDGTAYQRLGSGWSLAVVDPANGTVTVVPAGESIGYLLQDRHTVFGPDGTAYFTGSNVVVVVDPSTHSITPIRLPGYAGAAVSIGPDGKAYQVAGGQVLVISVADPPSVDPISM
jgi:VCBS repeat-containing protein